ncbi:MAG: hypothetical protein ACTSUE_10655 [Promethearchaeota archaeon]
MNNSSSSSSSGIGRNRGHTHSNDSLLETKKLVSSSIPEKHTTNIVETAMQKFIRERNEKTQNVTNQTPSSSSSSSTSNQSLKRSRTHVPPSSTARNTRMKPTSNYSNGMKSRHHDTSAVVEAIYFHALVMSKTTNNQKLQQEALHQYNRHKRNES